MKHNYTPIALAACICLYQAQAMAQQAPAAPADTVEVVGLRASTERSLQAKRNADGRIEVISAQDIGKMPDKNVADSLQRVPGVTISSASANEGGFDESDRVSMRGTSPSLTQTMINGHGVSSGDWFVLNQTGTVGRSVSYSLLPSELVHEVRVYKGQEARLVEGGVTGVVDIITRKPLQFRKNLTLEAQVGVVHSDLAGKTDPQLSGLINWKNDANTLGIMAQFFSETRHLRRDGQELLGYEQIKAGSAIATARPDLAGVWYPKLIGSALFEQKRKREGGLLSIQVKPSDSVTLGATAFMSNMEAGNYNRNYMLWPSRFLQEGAGQTPSQYRVVNNTLVSATFPAVAGTQYGVYDQISRPDAGSNSKFFTLDGSWQANDRLKLSAQAGTTRGTGKTPTQDVAEWNVGIGSGAAWTLNGIGSAANWSMGNSNAASPAGIPLGWIFGSQNVFARDQEDWLRLDGEYALDKGVFTTLRFGARMTQHTRNSSGIIGQAPGCRAADGSFVGFDWSQANWCPVGTQAAADPANFPTGFTMYPSNFGSGLGGSFPTNIWQYSAAQLAAYNSLLANRSSNGSREDWTAAFGLKEKTRAVYVQSDMEGKNWSGNLGLRLVQTEQRATNNVATSASDPAANTLSAFGPYKSVTTEHSYTDVLPSLNLRYKLSKELQARLSMSRSMARPDYSSLAGSLSLSPPASAGAMGSGSGGNADLKPVRSNNLDLTLEYYYAPRSLLSASLFNMNLSSYVGYGTVKKSFMTYSVANPQGVMADYLLTVPVNTKGTVKGLELAWEQPFMKNFGLAANYTYTDAKDDDGGPLLGASRNTYNVVGFYENDRVHARLAYTHRSSFYSGLDRTTAFYQADTSTLSASVGYKINDKLSLSLDARNLNNPKLRYYALNEDQPRAVYQNGRQFYLTLKMKL